MKKIFALAALGTMALVSCKKDYTCDCTVTYNGQTSTSSSAINKSKKKDAQDACDQLAATSTAAGATASCTLNKK